MKTLSRGLVAIVAAGLACSAHAADVTKVDMNAVVDTDAIGNSVEANAIWLAYAMGRSKVIMDRAERGEALTSGDDYEVELAGREMLAIGELAQKKTGAKSDAYLELVRKMKTAGFLDEYVVGAFAIPGWTIPAAAIKELDFDGFRAFVKMNPLGDHHPTHAYTEVKGKRWPDAPGANLIDPATLKIQGPVCVQTRETIAGEMTKWRAAAAELRGTPIAADNRQEFIRALIGMAKNGIVPERGATWVISRPSWLAYMDAFCAVELKDPAGAEVSAREAVALRPTWPAAHQELITVLFMLKKTDDADKAIDAAMGLSSDRCDLAAMHRRRGYIRIDQGRLEEARDDYRKSLEYEPGNDIATRELELIDREIRKKALIAGITGKDDAPWTPPPMGELGQSRCKSAP
jgi:tetratricopeptide (TPR) repeat protein